MLVIFAAVLTMYVTIIIEMYDPEMMKMLDTFNQIMPELMNAVGMESSATSFLGFSGFVSVWVYSAGISYGIQYSPLKRSGRKIHRERRDICTGCGSGQKKQNYLHTACRTAQRRADSDALFHRAGTDHFVQPVPG